MMKKSVLFLLCDTCICGGTNVILEHASRLEKQGYDVTIALVYMKMDVFKLFLKPPYFWHPALTTLKFIHIDQAALGDFDIAIYTLWSTVFYLPLINAKNHLYFVQSIESRFFPKEETSITNLVDKTYEIGLPVITEANWIKQYLETHYQSKTELVRNGINKSIYSTTGEIISEKPTKQLRILVEGPINVPYKNVERTIELCKIANVGDVWLLTSSECHNMPNVDRLFSKIPIHDVAKIYRSCDLIVKLSYVEGMFGPPLEMFHCGGTAIVYDVTGHDEYIKHNINALVAKSGDEESVIRYLKKLNKDRELLNKLKNGAIDTARNWPNWESTSITFAQSIENLAKNSLSTDQQKTLAETVREKSQEQIPVVISYGNENISTNLTGNLNNKIGHYTYLVPIFSGNTKLIIHFGEKYKSFYLTALNFHQKTNEQIQPNYKINWLGMSKDQNNKLICLNNDSACHIEIACQSTNIEASTLFHLEIEIRPFENKLPVKQLS